MGDGPYVCGWGTWRDESIPVPTCNKKHIPEAFTAKKEAAEELLDGGLITSDQYRDIIIKLVNRYL